MEIRRAAKPRPRSEFVLHLVQPLAVHAIPWLARRGVHPLHVVLSHGALGLLAAACLVAGTPLAFGAASILLLAKVLLDNMDGGLARATGRVTLTGRYLDTLVDFLVNLALFGALALHGPPLLAAAAAVVLTFVLSVDYNLERLYKEARALRPPAGPAPGHRAAVPEHVPPGAQAPEHVPTGAPTEVYRVLRNAYASIFAPQDRAIESLDRRIGEAVARRAGAAFDADARQAWNDLFSTATVVNLGLSTQLTVLAALVLLSVPFAFVAFVLLQAPYLMCLWLLRAARFRRYLRNR